MTNLDYLWYQIRELETSTILEWMATITGILCVYLQTKEKIWAWPFGVISVSMLAYIFFGSRLYSDFILHLIFLVLNVYGWWYWKSSSQKSNSKKNIVSAGTYDIYLGIAIVILGTGAWGYFMATNTNADYAYLDAFTTSGSLVAQFALAKKILQNWQLWIIVDIVAIGVYSMKELYVVAFLFSIYLILCVYGYIQWRRAYSLQV